LAYMLYLINQTQLDYVKQWFNIQVEFGVVVYYW
jgi:hypothetical protein